MADESFKHTTVAYEDVQRLRDQPDELMRVAGLGGEDHAHNLRVVDNPDLAQAPTHCHLVCFCDIDTCDCILFCH